MIFLREIKRHYGEHLWPRIRRGRQKPRIEVCFLVVSAIIHLQQMEKNFFRIYLKARRIASEN